jgi:hypothetical protein
MNPLMDRSFKIVPQLEQVCGSYCVMMKELKGTEKQVSSQCSCKEKENNTNTKILWGSGFLLFAEDLGT